MAGLEVVGVALVGVAIAYSFIKKREKIGILLIIVLLILLFLLGYL